MNSYKVVGKKAMGNIAIIAIIAIEYSIWMWLDLAYDAWLGLAPSRS